MILLHLDGVLHRFEFDRKNSLIFDKEQEIVTRLFEVYLGDYRRMPSAHADQARQLHATDGPAGGARVVADYIAGMTDRFALQAHDNL